MRVGKTIACMLAFFMLAIPVASLETAGMHNVSMPSEIVVAIEGGFGVTITIRNESGGPLPFTEWSVEMKGLIFSGGDIGVTIDPPSNETTIRLLPIGIGPGIMTIRLGNDSVFTALFFIVGPFVFMA